MSRDMATRSSGAISSLLERMSSMMVQPSKSSTASMAWAAESRSPCSATSRNETSYEPRSHCERHAPRATESRAVRSAVLILRTPAACSAVPACHDPAGDSAADAECPSSAGELDCHPTAQASYLRRAVARCQWCRASAPHRPARSPTSTGRDEAGGSPSMTERWCGPTTSWCLSRRARTGSQTRRRHPQAVQQEERCSAVRRLQQGGSCLLVARCQFPGDQSRGRRCIRRSRSRRFRVRSRRHPSHARGAMTDV